MLVADSDDDLAHGAALGEIAQRLRAVSDDGAMTFPVEEGPAVGEAAHAVVRAAQEAGVWIFGGGVENQRASIVATDGTVTNGPYPGTKAVIGGFAIIDVPSRDEALQWAAKIAVACRCAQELRELLPDPIV